MTAAALGRPRLHLRVAGSTNDLARELAAAGAPHGTLVTAAVQTAGRGRQGRSWSAPAGSSLLCSLVIREPPPLVSLRAGVAVAHLVDAAAGGERTGFGPARVKWPNDVLVGGRKVAGILVEGRPQEGWVVLGIGINVAVRVRELEGELRDRAASLGLEPGSVETVLASLLEELGRWLSAEPGVVLGALRARDALLGRTIGWAEGRGVAAGIDDEGRLLVDLDGGRAALSAGDVHLL